MTEQPAKYRKKPVVVEAVHVLGGTRYTEIRTFVGASLVEVDGWPAIRTLEGDMRITAGDWIIRGVKGEFYPCRNDIFLATYEAVLGD